MEDHYKEIIKFKLSENEEIKLKLIKGKRFIAKSDILLYLIGLGNIYVDELFKEFTYDEQKSIVFHEIWHRKNNLKFEILNIWLKKPWLIFSDNKISKLQEFEADKYAAKMAG